MVQRLGYQTLVVADMKNLSVMEDSPSLNCKNLTSMGHQSGRISNDLPSIISILNLFFVLYGYRQPLNFSIYQRNYFYSFIFLIIFQVDYSAHKQKPYCSHMSPSVIFSINVQKVRILKGLLIDNLIQHYYLALLWFDNKR